MTIEAWNGHTPRIATTAWVHHAATVIGDVDIGPESSVWPGAVLRGDFGPIRVGMRTSIQDNAVVHTGAGGTTIGSDCVVGHHAHVEDAIVEDACLIGVGARVLEGAILRSGAVVAAGAVLVGGLEVRAGTRAQGVPATLVADDRHDREWIRAGAAVYVEQTRRRVRAERRGGGDADAGSAP